MNPREGDKADRAVIMIDPFSDARDGEPPLGSSLLDVPLQLFTALKEQSRFKQFDLTLAEADDVYSRFLIAPTRGSQRGARAICSGGLGGFLGFFHCEFRHHDFMLGRANCHDFLRDWFVLPADNRIFRQDQGLWSDKALANKRFQSRETSRPNHRQIIPIFDDDETAPRPVDWPKEAFAGYTVVGSQIEARLDGLYPALRDALLNRFGLGGLASFAARVYLWPAWRWVLRGALLGKIRKSLDAAAADLRRRKF